MIGNEIKNIMYMNLQNAKINKHKEKQREKEFSENEKKILEKMYLEN